MVRLVEFFSGVGGMRMAVEQACRTASSTKEEEEEDHNDNGNNGNNDNNNTKHRLEACHAYEIAANANRIYQYNFADQTSSTTATNSADFQLHCREIQRLHVSELPVADLWTLSPPCQPFTRKPGAKHLDQADSRCVGLTDGVLRLLMELCHDANDQDAHGNFPNSKNNNKKCLAPPPSPPKWFLLENVKGFVGSDMCKNVKQVLHTCDYTTKEYLLSPSTSSCHIPNHRLRYYLLAERSSRFANVTNQVFTQFTTTTMSKTQTPRSVADYVDANPENVDALLVPPQVWQQPWAKELDVVTDKDTMTHCFTSSYGRLYHQASGSLYRFGATPQAVRRFSPREVARFLHFGHNFRLPPDLALERQYKHVCNAINVAVVAILVQELLFFPL